MIIQREIDGIPALIGPATGPMQAGLAFRVGLADEPLARRGITHLIEHLALHGIGAADYHYNGATEMEFTYFHMQGSEADIVAFLNGVCAALNDLPMDRLPVEKEILRTEASGRSTGPAELLALWRHGARDFGSAGFPEWGRTGITADDLRAWTARYFTRGNAALWIAGPGVPDGLRLDLPEGERQPVPAASSALPERPAFFSGPDGVVAWDAVVPREPAAVVFAAVLDRALFRVLRQENGLSYSVRAGYLPRPDGTTLVTAVADALPEKQGAVLGTFVDVLAGLRLGLIDDDQVRTAITRQSELLARAEESGARLPGQVFRLLTGYPVQEAEEALDELGAVTRDEVVAIAATAAAEGLLMAPGGLGADWAGFTAAPVRSVSVVEGTRYPSLEDPDTTLIIGVDGVSVVGPGQAVTVHFDRCAAMLAWPDGARRLIGHDAMVVHFEPTLYPDGHGLVPVFDKRVSPESSAPMPARPPEAVPAPGPRVREAMTARRNSRLRKIGRLLVLALLIVLLAALGLGAIYAMVTDHLAPLLAGVAVISSALVARSMAVTFQEWLAELRTG